VTVRAVIYDHDGTLVDSLPMVVAATNRVLVANGFAEEPPAAVIAGMVLATAPRMGHHARTTDPQMQSRMAAEFYAAARELGPLHARAYDGIHDVVSAFAARGIKQAVVSNNEGAVVRIIMRHLGLAPHFAALYGEDDVAAPKPDPRGIIQTAATLGVELSDCVFVGDSENDSDAARAAGVRSIGVTWGIHPRSRMEHLGFSALIDRPEQLRSLIG
jgi:2-phosphoglycolate phosphatase